MNIMLKLWVLMITLGVASTAIAATELRDSQMADMKSEAGHVSVNVRDGTFADAISALNKKADERGAKYFRVTSLDRAGMSSDVRASAVLYR